MNTISKERANLLLSIFPNGLPRVWCPALVHYKSKDQIDFVRIEAHLDYILQDVKSLFLPGSTGDGWELCEKEYEQIVHFTLGFAKKNPDIQLLIGLLHNEFDGMLGQLETVEKIAKDLNIGSNGKINIKGFKGFVVCPPSGKSVSESRMHSTFESLFKTEYPFTLYQLPQVTQNEMSPLLINSLADSFHNFIMVKDSSGADLIANTRLDYSGVVLIRGAEGNYSKMLKGAGGNYDGFLLSTANCFPKHIAKIVDLVRNKRLESADSLSINLTRAVEKIFNVANAIVTGNPFTNANKLIDHLNAYGELWREFPMPVLHSGDNINEELVFETESILKYYNLFPDSPYYLNYKENKNA